MAVCACLRSPFEQLQSFWGGTGLNGVTNLYPQALHHRSGVLIPALDFIAATHGYRGREAPRRDITQGDDWFWRAQPGYDRTTGVGVPDVANLLQALRELEP
jgi:hypothetical protein